MPNFTTEDLLLYMYNELKPEETSKLESTLQTEWALKQKFQVLSEAEERLNHTRLSSPRSETVNAIMRYAELNVQVSN